MKYAYIVNSNRKLNMSRTHHHMTYKALHRKYGEDKAFEIICQNHSRWYKTEPKWHRRLEKHKKRRAECRQLKQRVMRGHDEQVWPLDKKPWIYYW